MRKIFSAVGFVLIVINTSIGIIFMDYQTHRMLFGDISIAISMILVYILYRLKTSDGFKVGYTLLLGVGGLIRFICAVASPNEFRNNTALLIFMVVLCIECLVVYFSHVLRNK